MVVARIQPKWIGMNSPDSVVIGGGIVGLATALSLVEKYGRSVVVLEAEDRVAAHQTGHNSGVIHSGLYYAPGSLKATLCLRGLELMYRFCEAEGVPCRRTGKLVVAVDERDLPRLDLLEARGRANGVGVDRLTAGELREREPAVTGLAGLWVESTGIVDYATVARAMASRLERLGGQIRFRSRVIEIRTDAPGFALGTESGVQRGRFIVNCAGLQSDRVARLGGADPGVRIVPFRGEYYTLRPERASLVCGLIYPVPDPALPFLGVHFTRGIDGAVEAGPNAVLAFKREGYRWSDFSGRDVADWVAFPGFWRMGRRHWRTGIDEVLRSLSAARFTRALQRLVPAIRREDLVVGGAGVRAQAVGLDGALVNDFLMVEQTGALHLLNAPSPAATASLAIGEHIAALINPRMSTGPV